MLYILIALVVCIWLLISAVIYMGLWSVFLSKLGNVELLLVTLGTSVILSPGVAVGHGAIPFPGGLAFLFGGYSAGDRSVLVFNFVLWMVTFLIFLVFSRFLKKG